MNNEIKIRYFGPIRDIIGLREEKISIPEDVSVLELLKILIEKHKTKYKFFWYDNDKKLHPKVRVILEGKNVDDLNGLDTKLGGFSEIILMEIGSAGGG